MQYKEPSRRGIGITYVHAGMTCLQPGNPQPVEVLAGVIDRYTISETPYGLVRTVIMTEELTGEQVGLRLVSTHVLALFAQYQLCESRHPAGGAGGVEGEHRTAYRQRDSARTTEDQAGCPGDTCHVTGQVRCRAKRSGLGEHPLR